LTVERGAEKPEHVEERRRVIAEVARLIEAAGPERRETLGPRQERVDVGREALRTDHREPQQDAERDQTGDGEAGAPLPPRGAAAAVAATAASRRSSRSATKTHRNAGVVRKRLMPMKCGRRKNGVPPTRSGGSRKIAKRCRRR